MKRATRKSSIGLEEERSSVGNFSTRFSLPSFVRRVEKLTDDQRNAIKKMGFGHLLEMPIQTLNKNLLVELMERWSCEKHAFILLPGEITITLMDVALILGLRVMGDSVVLKEDEPFSDLEKEYGATISNRKIMVSSIENKLESIGEIANDDFARAFLLFTFGTFLFPNANGKVDSRYLSVLKDLDNVHQLAWGAAVLEDIIKWLSKKREMNVQYVGSCLIFLQIWSYEHIDIARPSLLDCYLTFPRACRWENCRSHQRKWITTKFKELQENQITWELQLTSEELEIDIIKELRAAQNDRTDVSKPEYLSSIMLTVDDDNLRIRSHLMDKQAVENGSEREIVREGHRIQENNLEHLRAPENVVEVLTDATGCPSASCCVSEEPKEQMQHPSTSKNSSMNFTISVEDDLRTRYQLLEEQNMKLMEEIDKLRRENNILRDQLLSSQQLEGQIVDLNKEVNDLRRDNELLSFSSNNLVSRLERLLLDEDVNATGEM